MILALALSSCHREEEEPPVEAVSGGGWESIDIGADYTWLGLCTIGEQTIYVIGREANPVIPFQPRHILKRSTDLGSTWSEVAPADGALHGFGAWGSVHFVTEDLGFVVGYRMAARTADGGSTWDTIPQGFNEFGRIAALSPSNMFGFEDGGFFRSTDEGLVWSQVTGALSNNVFSIDVLGSSAAWAVGIQGFWVTTDGGITWEQRSTHARGYQIDMVSPLVGAVLSDERQGQFDPPLEHLWVTEDGGLSWLETPVDTLVGDAYSYATMLFDADDRLIIRGDSGLIISADHGATWQPDIVLDGGFPVVPIAIEHCGDRVVFISGSKFWRKQYQ